MSLLASFFFPSHLSLKHVYFVKIVCLLMELSACVCDVCTQAQYRSYKIDLAKSVNVLLYVMLAVDEEGSPVPGV